MKRNEKSILFLALAVGIVGASTAGIVSINSNAPKAKAEVSVNDIDGNFEVCPGASVRLHETKTGIRFACEITHDYYEAVETAYPDADVKLATEISVNKADADPVVIWCSTTPEFTNGVFKYYASITFDGLTQEEITQAVELEMTATAQIYDYPDGGSPTLLYESEAGDTRSMKAVANMAKLNGEDKGMLDKYVGKATVSQKQGTAESVNTKTTLSLNVSAGTYEDAYIGANKVTLEVQADGSAVIQNADFANTTHGDITYVSVFSGGEIYATPVQYVTQALSNETELETLLTNGATIEGYYVLDSDITVEGWASNHLNMLFKGVLDGQGHTITMTDKINGGLLGDLYGTVKNLGIVFNVTKNNIYSYEAGQAAILARTPNNAIVENLYVKVNTAESITLNQSFSVFGSMWSGNNYKSFTNVVLDYTDSNMALQNSTFNAIGGYMFHEDHHANSDDLSYEGVYVISPYDYKYMHYDKNKKNVSRAENDTEVATPEGYKMSILTGVKRYQNWASLKKANNNITSFENKYWDTTSGAPVWHAIENEDLFVLDWTGENLIWSTNEKEVVIPEKMGAFANVAKIDNKTDGVCVYDGATWTTTTLDNTTNEMVSKEVRITFKDGTAYFATMDCVAQAISNATELETLLSANGKISGYYVLNTDKITISEWTTVANHRSLKFAGVFDGVGKSLEIAPIDGGLFGTLDNGTVKNLHIQYNVEKGYSDTTAGTNSAFFCNFVNGTVNLNNINIKLSGDTGAIYETFSMFGYTDYRTTAINGNNLVIDYGDVISAELIALQGKTSGLLLHSGYNKFKVKNVYLISSGLKYLTLTTSYYTIASNDTALTATGTKYTINTACRYDSWDKFDTSKDLSDFEEDYWDTTSGKPVWIGK